MNTAQRKALAICLSKRQKITIDDFYTVYTTEHARKNLLKSLKHMGYVVASEVSGFYHMPDGAPELAVRDLG